MIIVLHIISCTLAFWLDRLIGDPPKLPHPIIWIGNWISFATKKWNHGKQRIAKGFMLTLSTLLLTGSIVFALSYVAYQIHWGVYLIVQTVFMTIALAQKSLKQAALDVYTPLVSGDLQEARKKLSWIVGRDTEHLDEANITRGVIETVSENTSDGITAPLFYGFLFGATGMWVYKAINTLDSMVGYQNERFAQFGYCSAKLDDIVNWLPSRITGFLIVTCTNNETSYTYRERLQAWLQDAKKHPSPNSGYLEAATAYQFGIQLGGLNYYEGVASHRAEMGYSTKPLQAQDIQKTIRQMQQASIYFWLLCSILGGVIYYATQSWS